MTNRDKIMKFLANLSTKEFADVIDSLYAGSDELSDFICKTCIMRIDGRCSLGETSPCTETTEVWLEREVKK